MDAHLDARFRPVVQGMLEAVGRQFVENERQCGGLLRNDQRLAGPIHSDAEQVMHGRALVIAEVRRPTPWLRAPRSLPGRHQHRPILSHPEIPAT